MRTNSIFRVMWLSVTFFFSDLNNALLKKSKKYAKVRWFFVTLYRKIFYEKGICKYCKKEIRYKKGSVNYDICWMCYWAPPKETFEALKEKYK